MLATGRLPKNVFRLVKLTLRRATVLGCSRCSPSAQARKSATAFSERFDLELESPPFWASASILVAAVLLRSVAAKSSTLLYSLPATQNRYSHLLLRVELAFTTFLILDSTRSKPDIG